MWKIKKLLNAVIRHSLAFELSFVDINLNPTTNIYISTHVLKVIQLCIIELLIWTIKTTNKDS